MNRKFRRAISVTVCFLAFVGVVYGGPLIYEWYSEIYQINEGTLLTFNGSIEGNMTIHCNQTVNANIKNHAGSNVTGVVLVEIINSADNSTIFLVHNATETILAHSTWNMPSAIWKPNATGTCRIHVKIQNPQWSD